MLYNIYNWAKSYSKSLLMVPIIFSVLVFLLLVLFQPFDYRSYSFLKVISDALLSAFIVLFVTGLTRVILSFLFNNELMNIRSIFFDEIRKVFLDVLLFLIFSFLINIIFGGFDTINYSVWLWLSLKYILIFEAVFIPLSLFLKYYFYHLSLINEERKPKEQEGVIERYDMLNLGFVDKEKHLKILPDCLVMVKSWDNYIEVFYKENNEVVSDLLRNTIYNFNDMVDDYPFIIRCHRSYLINVNEVYKFTGSTRGYQLTVKGILDKVPVSRSRISLFKDTFKKIRG